MPDDKAVLNGTVNPTSVEGFFADFLSKRFLKSGPDKGKGRLDSKSLQVGLEALSSLRASQAADEPERFETEWEKV